VISLRWDDHFLGFPALKHFDFSPFGDGVLGFFFGNLEPYTVRFGTGIAVVVCAVLFFWSGSRVCSWLVEFERC
jgi:hypothetical protein